MPHRLVRTGYTNRELELMHAAHRESQKLADYNCVRCYRPLTVGELLKDECSQCKSKPSEDGREIPF